MNAKEFRNVWLKSNPNIIHIPSEHELQLMEDYARYFLEMNNPSETQSFSFYCNNDANGGSRCTEHCGLCALR